MNNTNALELLQSGAFKLVPGKDSVPYEQLKGLRLEDGIDVTRKVGQKAWEGIRVGLLAMGVVGRRGWWCGEDGIDVTRNVGQVVKGGVMASVWGRGLMGRLGGSGLLGGG